MIFPKGHRRILVARSPIVVLDEAEGGDSLGNVRVRPQVSPNLGSLQQLKEIEIRLYGSASLEVGKVR